MSTDPSVPELVTDAMPLPPRNSAENEHIDNTYIPNTGKSKTIIDNLNANSNGNYKIPRQRSKFKSKSKSNEGVRSNPTIIINSNGVNINTTTNYNFNKISYNVDNNLVDDKNPIRIMPSNVKELCQCDDEISVHDMLIIKMHLGSGWKDVARKIGFSDGQIYQFIENYKEWKNNGIDEVIYKLLLDWKQANSKDAKIGLLSSVMWSCREYDCVEKLAKTRKYV